MLQTLSAQRWKNRKNNSLVGDSQKSLDDRDAFFNRLGSMAYARKVEKPKEKSKYQDCKWFFILPSEYADENKNDTGLDHIAEPFNLEILTRSEKYKEEVGTFVGSRISMLYTNQIIVSKCCMNNFLVSVQF